MEETNRRLIKYRDGPSESMRKKTPGPACDEMKAGGRELRIKIEKKQNHE